MQAEKVLPGMEHGPTWHADSGTGTAGDVGTVERGTPVYKGVHVGGVYVWVAKRVYRVKPLVIGKKENYIRFHSFVLFVFVQEYLGKGRYGGFWISFKIYYRCISGTGEAVMAHPYYYAAASGESFLTGFSSLS